ncbi:TPA: helix-turn-helix domain-containing protein [Stenotrophomonas maltophilia]|uniref:helix-turn-helix domain-containing protein n=1 Tax=Stenotrophomonas maltophilia TaxID=40324 RepID=UPI000C153AE9|nr:helix-turn-helix domain-containing protein [Stenotrophomonas maltophilia]HDS1307946.1 helix-turn-helix domain-containing protein [Stenotrophomonas maltophilia]HDS1312485.1 helix-turn-helix domain-containing protein [Stenotrophomonas maltophilia]HDS1317215.1 helix-turn-helix domain-containing protein [Stenotrophomonas maltophilia]HDS1442101.1 helix-turn-helix domain-containing protein [Stenotrophomonas maltophilia]HDS1516890.1 helix-turn-helix domain-containing protein [Stenotrophomonas malt
MSTIIMSQCWPLQGLSVTQKAVLISLADQANDDGVCWPAVGTIAARCCMSARAVRSAMDHLEAVGLLARDRRFNSSTVYSVTPAKFNAAAAPSKGTRKTGKNGTAPGAGAAPRAGGAPAAGGDAPHAGGDAPGAGLGVRPVPPNRHITLNEPSGEPSFPAGLPATPPAVDSETELQAACRATWTAYATAYRERHSVAPVRNAKVNANVRQIVQRLGHSEAPLVAAWFLTVNERYVVQNMHDLGALLTKCEAYRTQWATGRQVTEEAARQTDKTQTNLGAADAAKALLAQRRAAHAG